MVLTKPYVIILRTGDLSDRVALDRSYVRIPDELVDWSVIDHLVQASPGITASFSLDADAMAKRGDDWLTFWYDFYDGGSNEQKDEGGS